MTSAVVEAIRQALLLTGALSAPFLLLSALAGVLVGLFAAATQIQDPSLQQLPRLAAVGAALALFGPGAGAALVRFTVELWTRAPSWLPGS